MKSSIKVTKKEESPGGNTVLDNFRINAPKLLSRFQSSGNRYVQKGCGDIGFCDVILQFPLLVVDTFMETKTLLILCSEERWQEEVTTFKDMANEMANFFFDEIPSKILEVIPYLDISHIWDLELEEVEQFLIRELPTAGYCHMLRTFPTYLGMVKGYRERPETLANDMLVSFEDISGIGQVRQMAIKDIVEGY